MTAQEVAYWSLQEQKRTNAANEAIRTSLAETEKKKASTQRLQTIWSNINDSVGLAAKALGLGGGSSGGSAITKALGLS